MSILLPPIPLLRHLYSIFFGVVILTYLFDTWYHVVFMAYPVYFMMMFLPRKTQHYYCITWVTVYYVGQTINRMLTLGDGFILGVTTYTMILLCKLQGLSWSYRDGGIANEIKVKNGNFDAVLSIWQKETAVHDLPSILEFTSFIFFFGGCICGPFMEFNDYKNWIEVSG